MNLRVRYGDSMKTVVTAHRGFSGRYPENTLLAFLKACEKGVDIVEFDVRESADGALVIIHDATLDRTTNGTGHVNQHTLSDLKRLTASYWQGSHDTGKRMVAPTHTVDIPTLEEALAMLAGKVGLNIQVYTDREESVKKIVRLYHEYDLSNSGFLMLRSFSEGSLVRAMSPDVAICIGEDRANLERHLLFGVDFVQPTRQCLTDEYVRRLLESGVPANVFFANDPETMSGLIAKRIPGIMTDVPDVLIDRIAAMREEVKGSRIAQNRIEPAGAGDA